MRLRPYGDYPRRGLGETYLVKDSKFGFRLYLLPALNEAKYEPIGILCFTYSEAMNKATILFSYQNKIPQGLFYSL
jgi:hypothetical protein